MRSLVIVSLSCLAACTRPDDGSLSARGSSAGAGDATAAARADSAFSSLQARGAVVMGVDQYTSKHLFESMPDGGRIVLERPSGADSAEIRTIRTHMRDIAAAFARGDFAAPGLVHAQSVPGTRVMAARARDIQYAATDLPRGAEVRIRTTDAAAVAAVHDFLAFQRSDHRAAGHEGMNHEGSEPRE